MAVYVLSGGLRVGEDRGKAEKGAIWWRHHTQPTVIRPLDQALEGDMRATQGYVPETTAWLGLPDGRYFTGLAVILLLS